MNEFFEHLRDPAPGFRCYRPGASVVDLEHTVRVRHELGAPASESDLETLERVIPDPTGQLRDLYSAHDGLVLYMAGATAGVRLFHVAELERRNEEWREWFELMDDEELLPFQTGGVAFGDIEGSGNYFVLFDGAVFYSDHDGADEEPLARSVSEFLDLIASDPPRFLHEAGCYTRYGDEQWIPGEYVADVQEHPGG